MAQAVKDVLVTPTDPRNAFAILIVAEMAEVDDTQWLQSRREVLFLIDRFK